MKKLTDQEIIATELHKSMGSALSKLADKTPAEMDYIAYLMFSTLGGLIYEYEGRERFDIYVKEIEETKKV